MFIFPHFLSKKHYDLLRSKLVSVRLVSVKWHLFNMVSVRVWVFTLPGNVLFHIGSSVDFHTGVVLFFTLVNNKVSLPTQ